jgi:hypothetical protein
MNPLVPTKEQSLYHYRSGPHFKQYIVPGFSLPEMSIRRGGLRRGKPVRRLSQSCTEPSLQNRCSFDYTELLAHSASLRRINSIQ